MCYRVRMSASPFFSFVVMSSPVSETRWLCDIFALWTALPASVFREGPGLEAFGLFTCRVAADAASSKQTRTPSHTLASLGVKVSGPPTVLSHAAKEGETGWAPKA